MTTLLFVRHGETDWNAQRRWQGEPTGSHAERVLAAVGRIAERHPEGRVLVVTHGGSMRRVHEHLGLDGRGPFDNCVVWSCAHEDGALRAIH